MKRILSLLICLLLAMPLFSCAAQTEQTETAAVEVFTFPEGVDLIDSYGTLPITAERDAFNPLTGLNDMARDRVGMRPFAIDVNNIDHAWPTAGLSQADVLIEYDAAGGIPRFVALYDDIRDVARVGSLRSIRQVAVDTVFQLNPVIVTIGHMNSVDDFLTEHADFRILDINDFPAAEYRDMERHTTYAIEHCKYTSGALIYSNLNDMLIKLEHKGDPIDPLFDFQEPSESVVPAGGRCSNVYVDFSYYAPLEFDYDAASEKWLRSQYGQPQIDANNGQQLAFDNVLLLFCPHEPDETNRLPIIDLTAGGEGIWLSRGGWQRFNWHKESVGSRYTFTDQDGEPLLINAGTTNLSLISSEYADTLKIS